MSLLQASLKLLLYDEKSSKEIDQHIKNWPYIEEE